jgi:hypothetical protein
MLADDLVRLGAGGVLVLAAERGLIVELVCLMPVCLCPEGRGWFEKRGGDGGYRLWGPSADRWPVPGRDGGLYTTDNVRLSHLSCNNADGGRLKLSEEARANLSAAMMGHEVSEETRAKLREARGRRITTDAARANMSAAQTGRKASEETRAKISAARKAYWARRRSA